MKFLRAQAQSINSINLLIQKSKSSWNYEKDYLKKALPLLRIDESYLNENSAFEMRLNGELVGFLAFASKGCERHLDHLWIDPEKLKMGWGRKALEFADKYALENGDHEIFTYPDPPAEGFYLKAGFVDTGTRVPSRVEGGPIFSVFVKRLI